MGADGVKGIGLVVTWKVEATQISSS